MIKGLPKVEEMYDGGYSTGGAYPTSQWEKWFAWHPVKIHGKTVWMKTVYRKYSWAKSTEQPFGKGYDYGTIFDVIRNEDV